MNLIIGGVYEKLDNKRDWLRVDGFTVYNSEDKYLGSEDYPIYHIIVNYVSAVVRINGQTEFIQRLCMRLAVDYIATQFKFIGVDLVK